MRWAKVQWAKVPGGLMSSWLMFGRLKSGGLP